MIKIRDMSKEEKVEYLIVAIIFFISIITGIFVGANKNWFRPAFFRLVTWVHLSLHVYVYFLYIVLSIELFFPGIIDQVKSKLFVIANDRENIFMSCIG